MQWVRSSCQVAEARKEAAAAKQQAQGTLQQLVLERNLTEAARAATRAANLTAAQHDSKAPGTRPA